MSNRAKANADNFQGYTEEIELNYPARKYDRKIEIILPKGLTLTGSYKFTEHNHDENEYIGLDNTAKIPLKLIDNGTKLLREDNPDLIKFDSVDIDDRRINTYNKATKYYQEDFTFNSNFIQWDSVDIDRKYKFTEYFIGAVDTVPWVDDSFSSSLKFNKVESIERKRGKLVENAHVSLRKFNLCMLIISAIFTGAFAALTFIDNSFTDKFSAFIGLICGLTVTSYVYLEGVGKEMKS